MPAKTHGLIILDQNKQPVCGPYGDVLLFKDREDATPYIPSGGSLKRVITAQVPRKKKKKDT